ncbi:1432_t:CDS:2 [Ambispora gerdemannii]|uniref:1432_t:CDS:1 n=1 Tax=Ambispora gerdemannii TaxID=144530 RepID=A0A9N8WJM9_9GLOM|nr:1432_t:CDS:2 [Ambispora gerdemannii]
MANSFLPNRFFILGALIILLSNIVVNNATLYPTFPDSNSILKPNDQIEITWSDNTKEPALSTLGSIKVEFMTGADLEQTFLAVIGTVPGSAGKIAYTIPTVEPAGKIYFIRFTSGADNTKLFFTTRFIITDPNGKYPPPPNQPPPVGKNPGGNGKIVSEGATPSLTSSLTNNSSDSKSAGNSSSSNTTHSAAPTGFQISELVIGLATLFTTTYYLLYLL